MQWTPSRIKKLRRLAGLTQEQLAERVGLTVQAVRHWEQGWRAPTGSAAKLLDMLAEQLKPTTKKAR